MSSVPHATTSPSQSTQAKPSPKREEKPLPEYNVVLLDDDQHTYEYVVIMLRRLFGHAEVRGYDLAKQVDGHGRAIVLTTHQELAELKRDQILAFGGDPRIASCSGSMKAVIEPVA